MINEARLLSTFLDLVQIDSPSGEEARIAGHVVDRLGAMGVTAEVDKAGNILAFLPGRGEPLLLNAHLDSVMPCLGVKPQVADGFVRSDGTTVLGADDKAGVAIILEAVQTVLESKVPTCPIDMVFTVGEEVGLLGAKDLDSSRLRARYGLILDHDGPVEEVVASAPSINNIEVTVHGRAAHAGISPETGVNAILIASDAITRFPIGRLDEETTSNVGVIRGGTARNIVPDLATVVAEARSHDDAKLEAQTNRIRVAFEDAAAKYGGTAEVKVHHSCRAFSIPANSPVFQRLDAAATALGITPKLESTCGGSDANVFNQHGIQCLVVSAGYGDVHTTKEWVSIDLMVKSANLVVKVLTQAF